MQWTSKSSSLLPSCAWCEASSVASSAWQSSKHLRTHAWQHIIWCNILCDLGMKSVIQILPSNFIKKLVLLFSCGSGRHFVLIHYILIEFNFYFKRSFFNGCPDCEKAYRIFFKLFSNIEDTERNKTNIAIQNPIISYLRSQEYNFGLFGHSF